MILHTIAGWLAVAVGLGLSLGTLGVGATMARKAEPLAGYLLIAAGALGLLLGCCGAIGRAASPDTGALIELLLHGAELAHTVLHGACILGAAVKLSQAATRDGDPTPAPGA